MDNSDLNQDTKNPTLKQLENETSNLNNQLKDIDHKILEASKKSKQLENDIISEENRYSDICQQIENSKIKAIQLKNQNVDNKILALDYSIDDWVSRLTSKQRDIRDLQINTEKQMKKHHVSYQLIEERTQQFEQIVANWSETKLFKIAKTEFDDLVKKRDKLKSDLLLITGKTEHGISGFEDDRQTELSIDEQCKQLKQMIKGEEEKQERLKRYNEVLTKKNAALKTRLVKQLQEETKNHQVYSGMINRLKNDIAMIKDELTYL